MANTQPQKPADQRISDVAQRWFLTEPLLFAMYCTHGLEPNDEMGVPLRCGMHRIEYSAPLIDKITDTELADRLKVEALRILLKHPYQRQPFSPRYDILYLASNVTISKYMGRHAFSYFVVPKDILDMMPDNYTFEEYYQLLCRMLPPDPNSPLLAEMAEGAALWDEDSLIEAEINAQIAIATAHNTWGTISGDMVAQIKASTVPPVNIANILKNFKQTIISQARDLTRMRPSRRYGFEQMGSRYAYTTGVLVALDVSGSVDDRMLADMLGLINRIFIQGVKHIDVVQFDARLTGDPEPITKAINTFKVLGRGGTDFQPAADYYFDHPEYDGLIYITDGCAPAPEVPASCHSLPVTWIIIDDHHTPKILNGWDALSQLNS